jgi:hypothetical protein
LIYSLFLRVAGTTGAVLTCPLEVVKTRLQASPCAVSNSSGQKKTTLNNHNNAYNATHKNNQLTNKSKLVTRLNCYSNILLRNNHLSHSTVVTAPTIPSTKNLIVNTFNLDSQIQNQNHRHTFPNNWNLPTKSLFTSRPDRIGILVHLRLVLKFDSNSMSFLIFILKII